jgi:hypothetical protein
MANLSKPELARWLVLLAVGCSGSVTPLQDIDVRASLDASSSGAASGSGALSGGAAGSRNAVATTGIDASGPSSGVPTSGSMSGELASGEAGVEQGSGATATDGAVSSGQGLTGSSQGDGATSDVSTNGMVGDGAGPTDLTGLGMPIALVTDPTGGGDHNINVIDDGVFPPVGSMDSSQQYDTYTGQTRTEDWIGYQFASAQTFGSLAFQEGKKFPDGGWFVTLEVQVLQGGIWVEVPGAIASPPYLGNDGVNYKLYTFDFPASVGTAIRIDGMPGGSATFISVGELRVYGVP